MLGGLRPSSIITKEQMKHHPFPKFPPSPQPFPLRSLQSLMPHLPEERPPTLCICGRSRPQAFCPRGLMASLMGRPCQPAAETAHHRLLNHTPLHATCDTTSPSMIMRSGIVMSAVVIAIISIAPQIRGLVAPPRHCSCPYRKLLRRPGKIRNGEVRDPNPFEHGVE